MSPIRKPQGKISSLLKKSALRHSEAEGLRHSEAEGRRISDEKKILRFAQDDKNGVFQQTVRLNPLDKRVLNRLQEDIPFASKPWGAIARELNIGEDLLLSRIAILKDIGAIRRISAGFSPRKVNFVSTLVAVKAAPGKIAPAAKAINLYPEVTHNYRRSGPYDLWFTLVARQRRRIANIIRELKGDKNIVRLAEFPAVKIFKINVKLRV